MFLCVPEAEVLPVNFSTRAYRVYGEVCANHMHAAAAALPWGVARRAWGVGYGLAVSWALSCSSTWSRGDLVARLRGLPLGRVLVVVVVEFTPTRRLPAQVAACFPSHVHML